MVKRREREQSSAPREEELSNAAVVALRVPERVAVWVSCSLDRKAKLPDSRWVASCPPRHVLRTGERKDHNPMLDQVGIRSCVAHVVDEVEITKR